MQKANTTVSVPANVITADAADTLELGLLDLVVILGRRKRLLCYFLLFGGAASVILALLLPNTYTATAVIVPPQQPQSTATALLGQLAPLAAMAGRDLGIKALSPGEQYVALLQSRTISDNLIARFHLRSIYRASTNTDARDRLIARTDFTTGKGALITITVKDTDQRRASDLAAAYVEELAQLNARFAVTEAGERRAFLESRMKDERRALADAEVAFQKSQVKSGIVHIDSQAQVTIAAIAQLRAQIAAGEVAIQQIRLGATANNPAVIQSETELSGLRSQLRKLQVNTPRSAGDPILPTGALPEAGLDYLRLLRELKYHEFLFEMLSKQYEAACLDESKAAPAIQVVDRPIPPDKRSGPYRSLIVIVGLVLSAIAAFVYA